MSNEEKSLQYQEYMVQGKTLYTSGNHQEALKYFQMAEREDPRDRESYIMQGECLIMLDRFDDAESVYRKVLLLCKNDGEAYFHLGNVAFLKNDPETGRSYYAQAINAGYDVPEIYLHMGFMAYNEGNYGEAIAQFNKVLAKDKFNADAHLNKARSYMALNRMEEALQAFDSMIQYVPEVFEGHHYKLLLLLQLNRVQEAVKVSEKMERLFPDDIEVHYDHLLTIEAQGKPADALKYYDAVFSDITEDLFVMERAKILTGLPGRGEEALELFEHLAASEDASIAHQAQFFSIVTAMGIEQFERGLVVCEQLMKAPEKDDVYYNALYFRGLLLEKLNNNNEAKKAYQFAVAELRMATAKQPGALDYYLLRIMAHKNLKEYQRALELANYLLSVNPSMPEALYVRAELYSDMHMDAEAAKDREALRENPGMYSGIMGYLFERG